MRICVHTISLLLSLLSLHPVGIVGFIPIRIPIGDGRDKTRPPVLCDCHLIPEWEGRPYGNCSESPQHESRVECPTGTCMTVTVVGHSISAHIKYCGRASDDFGCQKGNEDGYDYKACFCTCDHCNTQLSCDCPNNLEDECLGILRSPRLTDFGNFGKWEVCAQGRFVGGMRLQTHQHQGGGANADDTALNSITFYCSKFETPSNSPNQPEIKSLQGTFGTYNNYFFCPGTTLAIGFQMRSQKHVGQDDDTAANNLRLFCENGTMLEGDGLDLGEWTDEQRCPQNTMMCGMRTQVEPTIIGDDNTALNNLDVKCCNHPLHPPTTTTTTTPQSTTSTITTTGGSAETSCQDGWAILASIVLFNLPI